MEIFIEYLESNMNNYKFIILDSDSYEIGNFTIVINECNLYDSYMEMFLDAYEIESEEVVLDETINYLNNNLDIFEEVSQGSGIVLSVEIHLVDEYKKINY